MVFKKQSVVKLRGKLGSTKDKIKWRKQKVWRLNQTFLNPMNVHVRVQRMMRFSLCRSSPYMEILIDHVVLTNHVVWMWWFTNVGEKLYRSWNLSWQGEIVLNFTHCLGLCKMHLALNFQKNWAGTESLLEKYEKAPRGIWRRFTHYIGLFWARQIIVILRLATSRNGPVEEQEEHVKNWGWGHQL